MPDRKRQIPKIKEICADKKYNDLVYAYLQTISDDRGRILDIQINFSDIAKIVGLSRQTVASRFKHLMDMELLFHDNETKEYELTLLDSHVAALIPEKTLQMLIDAMNEKSISLYVYLFMRFYANKNRPFTVTYPQLKDWIGITTSTTSNNSVISNILTVLGKLGLIEYEFVNNGRGFGVVCKINKVNLTV
jgi:hypothetical protein